MIQEALLVFATATQHEQGTAELPRCLILVNKVESLEPPIRNLIKNAKCHMLIITPAHLDSLPTNVTEILADQIEWIERLKQPRKILPRIVVIYESEHILVNLNMELQSHIISLLQQMSDHLIITVRHEALGAFKLLQNYDRIYVYEEKELHILRPELIGQYTPIGNVVLSKLWEPLGFQ